MVVDKELLAFEATLRLDIARATGKAPVVEEPKKVTVPRKKIERKVVLGISNNRGHDITEFVFESKAILELPAEMKLAVLRKHKALMFTRSSVTLGLSNSLRNMRYVIGELLLTGCYGT